jgi:hypothetical protein
VRFSIKLFKVEEVSIFWGIKSMLCVRRGMKPLSSVIFWRERVISERLDKKEELRNMMIRLLPEWDTLTKVYYLLKETRLQ